jgi:peptide/nickel transport system substrate-binding protein
LVELDDSLNIKPSLARSWEVSDDGLTYSFHLRQDVYFHDHPKFTESKGRKVVASDFVYSFLRIVDSKVASPGISFFKIVATPYNDYGFKAINDSIFQIKLKRPFSSFLGILSMPYCFVVPKEIVEYYGNDFRSNPVGTGPFMFKVWREGEKLIFIKNQNYFEKDAQGNRLPYLDAVSITFIADKQSEFLEFMKGNIDFLNGVNAAYKDELITRTGKLNAKHTGSLVLEVMPQLDTEYITFLLDSAIMQGHPLLNKNIRLAINHGFDREKMVKYLRNNLCSPAFKGIIPKGLPGYADVGYNYTFDPDLSRNLLKKAGYSDGKGLPEFTLSVTSDNLDLCEFIQHELSQVGIKINIEVSTLASFKQNKANGKLEFFKSSWIADYPDAENYLSLFYSKNFSPNGSNYSHYKNNEYDKLYDKAISENNFENRMKYYREMNEIIVNNGIIVPLYYDNVVRIYSKNILNFKGNPLNLLKLKHVYKVKNR